MQVEKIKLDFVIPYSWNNKVHTKEQISRIANSIKRFGFLTPIVIDENGIILSGHGRYEAAMMLKMKEVPVIIKADLGDAEKKAYRIVDNKTASDTSYDYGNLGVEIDALKDLGYDVEDFHFEEFKHEGEEGEEEKKNETLKNMTWVGQIKLKVAAEEIDEFEADLDALVSKYNSVIKETKRTK